MNLLLIFIVLFYFILFYIHENNNDKFKLGNFIFNCFAVLIVDYWLYLSICSINSPTGILQTRQNKKKIQIVYIKRYNPIPK